MKFLLCFSLITVFLSSLAQTKKAKLCRLEIYDVETGLRETVFKSKKHFEAPNWSLDGEFLLFNSAGRLYKLPLDSKEPEILDTGFAKQCNNDHGFTPDGQGIILSNNDPSRKTGPTTGGTSRIYSIPIKGGLPKLLTPKAASYWHG
ncbi:MAG: transporter, partial [Bacteroidota bacterium]